MQAANQMKDPVAGTIKFLFLLLAASGQVWAVSPGEQVALDRYISKAEAFALAKSGGGVRQKLENLEKELFPIFVFVDRAMADMVRIESNMDRRMAALKAQANYNPYSNAAWKLEAQKVLVPLCCEIKADPRWQQVIQNRVARGLEALPPNGELDLEAELKEAGIRAFKPVGDDSSAKARGDTTGNADADRAAVRGSRRGTGRGAGTGSGQGNGGGGRRGGRGGGGQGGGAAKDGAVQGAGG